MATYLYRSGDACIRNGNEVLASLGAIWDADDKYRRVIRAELASECADVLRALMED